MRRRLVFCFAALFAAASPAKERPMRRYDPLTGYNIGSSLSLAQDKDGFLWIGTNSGLLRFDGSTLVRWAADRPPSPMGQVEASPSGEVAVLPYGGSPIYRVTSSGIEPLAGPDGQSPAGVREIQYDGENGLWAAVPGGLLRRAPDGRWSRIALPSGVEPRHLDPYRGASILVSCYAGGLWRADASGNLVKLWAGDTWSAVEFPAGSLFVGERYHENGRPVAMRLGIVTNGVHREVYRYVGDKPNMLVRNGRLWFINHSVMGTMPADGEFEVLPRHMGLQGAHGGLVDREGSLWIAAGQGLIQFPEPDTEIWGEMDGLHSSGARFLARTSEGMWVSTWGGLQLLDNQRRRFEAVSPTVGDLCLDRGGMLWGPGTRAPGRFHTLGDPQANWVCSASADGSMWIANPALYRSAGKGSPPEAIALPPGEDPATSRPSAVYEDRERRLWLAIDEKLCWAPIARLMEGDSSAWTCSSRHKSRSILSMVQTETGDLWIGTVDDGIWRFNTREWNRVPGSQAFPSSVVPRLTASRDGGVWVVSLGVQVRVRDRPDLAAGFEVLETVSAWQRGGAREIGDLFEDADGSLWLAAGHAIIHIPGHARRVAKPRPELRLIGVRVNTRAVSGTRIEAPAGSSLVEVEFAALSYRDRNLLRYEYRTRADSPWTRLGSAQPLLRLADLRAGDYAISLRASLDGEAWSEIASPVVLRVLRPWYLRNSSLALFACLLGGLLAIAYRVRVGVLLRMERQRQRIAMDLHDELGSGLGSIGILSSLAAQDGATDQQRREFSRKIADGAAEMGATLSEIVWSMKNEGNTLEDIAGRMVRRAEALFPGDSPRFEFEPPDEWPSAPLGLALRRNLMAIAREALHNAARHSRATCVKLSIRSAGEDWELRVEDNGIGLNGHATANGGNGLSNMRARAAEAGASLKVGGGESGGCRIAVRFK